MIKKVSFRIQEGINSAIKGRFERQKKKKKNSVSEYVSSFKMSKSVDNGTDIGPNVYKKKKDFIK